ncbi:MAG TPA: hypothetical protein VFX61_01345 [Micromonosporaceae bacterium]|nr:hypothetical protein [Micromonosporaceae bacterium]
MRRLWLVAVVLLLAPLPAACTTRPGTPPAAAPSTTATASGAETADATEAAIASLLARPLRLPTVSPGEACPVSGVTTRSPAAQESAAEGLGTGPLYPITFYIGQDATLRLGAQPPLPAKAPGPDGLYKLKVVWASTGAHPGPAVVRVGRLDGTGGGFVELSYRPDARRGDAVVFALPDVAADFPSTTSVSGPGCYAYQIDGMNHSEVIVFRVVE